MNTPAPTTIVVSIDDDACMSFLVGEAGPGMLSCGPAVIRRASHVEPIRRPLRIAFHLVRRLFGETGRVSDWTRHWRVTWRVNLAPSNGPVLGPFPCRTDAIAAEVAWLQEYRL